MDGWMDGWIGMDRMREEGETWKYLLPSESIHIIYTNEL
jgi:hypothetical protein